MTVQAHVAAFLALLQADANLTVYDGAVPNGAVPPYVLVYTTVDDTDGQSPDWGDSLDGTSGAITARAYCHSVGDNQTAARVVAGRVRAALLNVRPTITGRVAGMIRQDFNSPPVRDETTGVLVMDMTDVYRVRTVPA